MFEILTTPLNKVRRPTTHKPVRKMRVAVFCSLAPSALLSIQSVVWSSGLKPWRWWIILGVLVVLVLMVVGVYNGLVKSRMQTREAWSQIDVQLKRRNDLIPNLIETVKGYAKYEGDTLAKVTQLRQQVAQASSPAEAMAASDALSRQVAGIFAVAENYPDLKANTNFMQLQEELTNTENKISYARQLYNSVTSNYNVKLETFPTNVIAGMFGFRQAEFLQVPEEEKAVPKVDFSGLGD